MKDRLESEWNSNNLNAENVLDSKTQKKTNMGKLGMEKSSISL